MFLWDALLYDSEDYPQENNPKTIWQSVINGILRCPQETAPWWTTGMEPGDPMAWIGLQCPGHAHAQVVLRKGDQGISGLKGRAVYKAETSLLQLTPEEEARGIRSLGGFGQGEGVHLGLY